MLIVGLTGGIASGKSTAAATFAQRGVEIVDTDRLARSVVQPASEGLRQVVEAFGVEILTTGGELDRERLRQRIFADCSERVRLEGILHPMIRSAALECLKHCRGPYVILIAPLLLESGMTDLVDRILVVDVPVALQRRRLLAREPVTASDIERILAAQASRAARLSTADDVIDNSGTLADLEASINWLHEHYLQLAQDSA